MNLSYKIQWLQALDDRLWIKNTIGQHTHITHAIPSIAEIDRVLEFLQESNFFCTYCHGASTLHVMCALTVITPNITSLLLTLCAQHFEVLRDCSKDQQVEFFKQLVLTKENIDKCNKYGYAAYIHA